MAQSIDARTAQTIRTYLRDTRGLGNEAARRQRFSALVGELFPNTPAVTDFARGVEKLIRIKTPEGERRGHADAYYGNAVIEFEKSLKATLHDAEQQLRDYVSGLWTTKEEQERSLLAIASDGVAWRIYRPKIIAGAPARLLPEHIQLDLLRPEFRLTEETLGDFWLWLTSFLFRPQQVEPSPERVRIDFAESLLYREAMVAFKRAWVRVSAESEAVVAFETWQKYLTVTYGRLTESAKRHKESETGVEISELEDLFLRHTYLSASPAC